MRVYEYRQRPAYLLLRPQGAATDRGGLLCVQGHARRRQPPAHPRCRHKGGQRAVRGAARGHPRSPGTLVNSNHHPGLAECIGSPKAPVALEATGSVAAGNGRQLITIWFPPAVRRPAGTDAEVDPHTRFTASTPSGRRERAATPRCRPAHCDGLPGRTRDFDFWIVDRVVQFVDTVRSGWRASRLADRSPRRPRYESMGLLRRMRTDDRESRRGRPGICS